ncbi:MAG: hypothetical protein IJR83_06465 [Clostridia bacterium]|nr:hypothetical protein [Clostridia bacterium]
MPKMRIGININADQVLENTFLFNRICREGNMVDFAVCHMEPFRLSLSDACREAATVATKLKELNIDWIANFEYQNFHDNCVGPDGYDWAAPQPGLHRLELPKEYIEALSSCKNLIGIMYDEFEHVIINRNLSLKHDLGVDLPVFDLSGAKDAASCSAALEQQLGAYADGLIAKGAPALAGEHVFPVLFHTFAKKGIIPNFKSQKESFSNIQFACAAGAALEYGTPLWNCVDMWYHWNYPGHSAKEMHANLMFAYYAGVDCAYVEGAAAFLCKDINGEHYNEFGDFFSIFSKNFRGRERNYGIADYRPQIGIIKPDDTYWGQGAPGKLCKIHWDNCLYGNPDVKPGKESNDWIRAFSVITMGESGPHNVTWNRNNLWSRQKLHRSFATMNAAAVFDENVRLETLQSLKLCFLCGAYVSEQTLEDVAKLVRENGLCVVAPRRLLPADVLSMKKEKGIIRDGAGMWIVSARPDTKAVRKLVAPYLGQKGQIRLTFRDDTEVVLDISSDGETLLPHGIM